jgi:hypothetical protein
MRFFERIKRKIQFKKERRHMFTTAGNYMVGDIVNYHDDEGKLISCGHTVETVHFTTNKDVIIKISGHDQVCTPKNLSKSSEFEL